MDIALLDTSVATDNLGDHIIMDAVERVISEILPNAYVHRVATHEYMSWVSRRILRKSAFSIVGGTNLLSSHMGRFSLWKIMPWDVSSLNRTILLGAGWRTYMGPCDAYTRWLLQRVLSNGHIHSVRDAYTKEKLMTLGKKVYDTACPTMWQLSPEHCDAIPRNKADDVVTTLTFYRPDPERDRALLNTLKQHYRKVYFWGQQSEDRAYLETLGVPGIAPIPPTVTGYNELLDSTSVDFVGSRLHGGIRALQSGRRSLILAIDNRASEIGKSYGLPVLPPGEMREIEAWICGSDATSIRLPGDAILAWKAQFNDFALSSARN